MTDFVALAALLSGLAGAAMARMTTRERCIYDICGAWQRLLDRGKESKLRPVSELCSALRCTYCALVWYSAIFFILWWLPYGQWLVGIVAAIGAGWAVLGFMGAYAENLRD